MESRRKHLLVLFDIDGTILIYKKYFSRQVFASIIKEVFNKEISLSVLPNFAGMTDLQILKDIADVYNIPEPNLTSSLPVLWDKLLAEFKKISNPDSIELLPGIPELLNLLHEDELTQLGLLTGNFKENAYLKLNAFGLSDYFNFGAFGSESANRSDLPAIAIQRANNFRKENIFSIDNTIIIGDSPMDIECAKSNKIPVVSVATGLYSEKQLSEFNPDKVFSNFHNFRNVYDTIISF